MNRIIVFALLSGTLSMPAAAQDPHAGHAMPPPTPNPPAAAADDAVADAPSGSELPVGDAPPPAVILDSVADQVYGTPAMDRAREELLEVATSVSSAGRRYPASGAHRPVADHFNDGLQNG